MSSQDDLEEDQTLESDRKMVKTYIIESNVSSEEFIHGSGIITDYRVIEPDLYEFHISEERDKRFYLDSSDERFWSMHTLVGSQLARQTFVRITGSDGNGLDHPWIPNKTQNEILDTQGEFKGAGYNQHGVKAFPSSLVDVGDFSLNFNGEDADRFHREFNEQMGIDSLLSLSRIKIRTKDGENYLTQRITNEGAFTARAGTDIDIHRRTVDYVKDKYKNIINAIESNHLLRYDESDGGVNVNGRHIRINLENPIEDLEEFTSHLVNAKMPFRLMGPKTSMGDGYLKVRAVDLHNGDKVTLEIGPTWIRLYLYEGACGNTALRIFTNLQHHYDPSSTMHVEGVENV